MGEKGCFPPRARSSETIKGLIQGLRVKSGQCCRRGCFYLPLPTLHSASSDLHIPIKALDPFAIFKPFRLAHSSLTAGKHTFIYLIIYVTFTRECNKIRLRGKSRRFFIRKENCIMDIGVTVTTVTGTRRKTFGIYEEKNRFHFLLYPYANIDYKSIPPVLRRYEEVVYHWSQIDDTNLIKEDFGWGRGR